MRAYGSIAPRSVPVSEFRICRVGGRPGPHFPHFPHRVGGRPGPHLPHRSGGGKCYHPAMPAKDWL